MLLFHPHGEFPTTTLLYIHIPIYPHKFGIQEKEVSILISIHPPEVAQAVTPAIMILILILLSIFAPAPETNVERPRPHAHASQLVMRSALQVHTPLSAHRGPAASLWSLALALWRAAWRDPLHLACPAPAFLLAFLPPPPSLGAAATGTGAFAAAAAATAHCFA